MYALVLAPCRRVFEAFENANYAKPPVRAGNRELRGQIRDRETRSLPDLGMRREPRKHLRLLPIGSDYLGLVRILDLGSEAIGG